MNLTKTGPPTAWEIADEVRPLEFDGWRIGHTSTRAHKAARWTEISIYRTVAGTYIVQSEGVSLVYHRNDGRCEAKTEWEIVPNSKVGDDAVPCPVCTPPSLDRLDEIKDIDTDTYRVEVTESNAHVCNDPKQIIRALTYQGRLAPVATRAIREAIRNDPELRQTFSQTERIA